MRRIAIPLVGILLSIALSAIALGSDSAQSGLTSPTTSAPAANPSDNQDSDNQSLSLKDRLISKLPPIIGDDLELNAWGWLGGYQTDDPDDSRFWDGELSFGATKSFDQRVTISSQVNFIDADNIRRVELEQTFASILLNDNFSTILTVGKFNSNIGVEERDFWNRTTGTTSLLFGAQPQDFVGAMITQPVGKTGLTLQPFVSADFQGEFNFNQSPGAGFEAKYQPVENLSFAVTNWTGPGFLDHGGRTLIAPYEAVDYDEEYSNPIANWQGPNFTATEGGSLYFLDDNIRWHATRDLTLSFEHLLGTSNSSKGHYQWWGLMLLANYDLTDRWRAFCRYSYLDDSDWLVTGTPQRLYEGSGGVSYEILEGCEVRGEYRYDESDETGHTNTVSLHLSFSY